MSTMPLHHLLLQFLKVNKIHLLVISLCLLSCGTTDIADKTSMTSDRLDIVHQEIMSQLSKNDTLLVEEKFSNHYLREIIKDCCKNYMVNYFPPEEIEALTDQEQLNDFIDQLDAKNPTLKTWFSKQEFPFPVKLYNRSEEENDSKKQSFRERVRARLTLSEPVVTMDGKYALIYFAHSKSMVPTANIKVYKKVDDKWQYYRTFYEWLFD